MERLRNSLKHIFTCAFAFTTLLAVAQISPAQKEQLIKQFYQQKNVAEKSRIAFLLGEDFWNVRKLPQASFWLKACIDLTPTPSNSNNVVNALDLLANVYLNESEYDSALYFSVKSFDGIETIANKRLWGNLYQTKARIYMQLGDEISAFGLLSTADSLYESSPDAAIRANSPYVKIAIGQLFLRQLQIEKAKEYFEQALEVSEAYKVNFAIASSLQALANSYCEMKQYKKALAIYKRLLSPPLYVPTSYRAIYIYAGLGDVMMGLNRPDSALYYYQLGMKETKAKAEWYKLDLVFLKMATAYFRTNKTSQAKAYYDSTLYWSNKNKNHSTSIAACQGLADIAIADADYKTAYHFAQLKQALSDSVFNGKSLEMSHKLYVLRGIKQKDAAILNLTQLDANNQKLLRQGKTIRYLLYGLMGLLALSIIIIINRAKLKRQIDKQKAVAAERERITADLHDDVGATLSSLHIYGDLAHTVWESQPDTSKEMLGKMTQQSKDLMNRMGDIIWSMKPSADEKHSFSIRLKNFSNELLAAKNIACHFDIDESLNRQITQPNARKNILLITKEVMNNIAKYSGATNVHVRFVLQDENVLLQIKDNGKGYDEQEVKHGNGLTNIARRCRQLGGNCHVRAVVGNGVSVECLFPIAIISHAE